MTNSRLPIFGFLAVVFPVLGVAMIWWVLDQTSTGNAYGVGMAIPLFGVPSSALGIVSAVVAILRKERWRWLSWSALVLNLAPLGWLLTEI